MHAGRQERLGLLPVPLPGGIYGGAVCACSLADDVVVVYEAGVALEDGDLACWKHHFTGYLRAPGGRYSDEYG